MITDKSIDALAKGKIHDREHEKKKTNKAHNGLEIINTVVRHVSRSLDYGLDVVSFPNMSPAIISSILILLFSFNE